MDAKTTSRSTTQWSTLGCVVVFVAMQQQPASSGCQWAAGLRTRQTLRHTAISHIILTLFVLSAGVRC